MRIEERSGRQFRLVREVPTTVDGSFQLAVRPAASTAYRARWRSVAGDLTSVRVAVIVARPRPPRTTKAP